MKYLTHIEINLFRKCLILEIKLRLRQVLQFYTDATLYINSVSCSIFCKKLTLRVPDK